MSPIRKRILSMFDHGATWTNRQLAEQLDMTVGAVSFHTGKMKKEGLLKSKGTVIKRVKKSAKKPVPTPVDNVVDNVSVKVLLLSAREGIDEALKRIEAAEVAMQGGGLLG